MLDVVNGNFSYFANERNARLEAMESHSQDRRSSGFYGYTTGQLKRWVTEGYSTDVIQGLQEFIPPVREKRRLQFLEEGDELHLDIAWSGSDNYFSEWTKREVIPGLACK